MDDPIAESRAKYLQSAGFLTANKKSKIERYLLSMDKAAKDRFLHDIEMYEYDLPVHCSRCGKKFINPIYHIYECKHVKFESDFEIKEYVIKSITKRYRRG